MERVDYLAELEAELRRQDEALSRLRAAASDDDGVQLRLGDELRERIGALADEMVVAAARRATTPVRGIAV
ncbi:MAG: hypothetical protein NVS3B10_17330 [Polyangiales bacterium]